MEKITDFFKELKDRLSNPFISSFIISWMVVNWNLVIALCFYDRDDFKLVGKKGFIDYASDFDNDWTLWGKPLILALGYTFLFPFFRNLILTSQSWFKRWGSQWTRRASKGSMIDIRKYMVLRDEYSIRTEQLIKLVDEESDITNKNAQLQTEIIQLKGQINTIDAAFKVSEKQLGEQLKINSDLQKRQKDITETHQREIERVNLLNDEKNKIFNDQLDFLRSKVDQLNNADDVLMINGEYRISPFLNVYSNEEVWNYRIENGMIVEVTNLLARVIEKIEIFYLSYDKKSVSFSTRILEGESICIYDLHFDADFDVFYGKRNGEEIQMQRIH